MNYLINLRNYNKNFAKAGTHPGKISWEGGNVVTEPSKGVFSYFFLGGGAVRWFLKGDGTEPRKILNLVFFEVLPCVY